MLDFLFAVLAAVRVFVRSRSDTALEVLALRQQVAVLKRQRPRPTLTRLDRFFWSSLRHLWPRWSDVLLIVKPETVVRPQPSRSSRRGHQISRCPGESPRHGCSKSSVTHSISDFIRR
jgi:hypothetical protein